MKNKKVLLVIIVVLILAAVGGYFAMQNVTQNNLTKTANTSHTDDARYISFGANYVFAVPSSFVVDDTSIAGVELLVPANGGSLSVESYDQLFDATVVAVQPISQVTPNNNKSLKDYIEQTILPDLTKNLSSDITTTYKLVGKYQSAVIIVKKDGQQIRRMYAYGGPRPYLVTAKEKTDVSTEVTTTLIGVDDSTSKTDIEAIKTVVQSGMNLLIQGKLQELYNSGSSDFKQKTSLKDLTSAVNSAGALLRRNIVANGGTLRADQFVGQLFFTPPTKDDQASTGTISLSKEDGQWKVSGFQLPSATAAPTPKK